MTAGLSTPRVGTTSDNGEVTFDKLPLYDEQGNAITYTLTESSTPDNYIQLTEPIEVSFTAETKPDGGVYWKPMTASCSTKLPMRWSTDSTSRLSTPAAAASTGRACWARAQLRRASST